MKRLATIAAVLLAGTNCVAAEEACSYLAPNGHEASFEPGYLVIHQGSDDRWCETEFSPEGGIAWCPSESGILEMPYQFGNASMTFDGLEWRRVCGVQV